MDIVMLKALLKHLKANMRVSGVTVSPTEKGLGQEMMDQKKQVFGMVGRLLKNKLFLKVFSNQKIQIIS